MHCLCNRTADAPSSASLPLPALPFARSLVFVRLTRTYAYPPPGRARPPLGGRVSDSCVILQERRMHGHFQQPPPGTRGLAHEPVAACRFPSAVRPPARPPWCSPNTEYTLGRPGPLCVMSPAHSVYLAPDLLCSAANPSLVKEAFLVRVLKSLCPTIGVACLSRHTAEQAPWLPVHTRRSMYIFPPPETRSKAWIK